MFPRAANCTYVVLRSPAEDLCTGIVKHVAANIYAHYVCADVTRDASACRNVPFHVNLETITAVIQCI